MSERLNRFKYYPDGCKPWDNTVRYLATGELRHPVKGEWYLSGAIIEAWRATSNMDIDYYIAKPVKMFTSRCTYCDGHGLSIRPAAGGARSDSESFRSVVTPSSDDKDL